MQYLTEKDWIDFEYRYPDAYLFLLARRNYNEYNSLKKELEQMSFPNCDRGKWIKDRLLEMEIIQPTVFE